MTNKTRTTLFALLVCAFVAAACGGDSACAAPADSQQYSSSAAAAEAANAVSNALTLPNRLVRDGKGITADSDGAGSSPINPGLKTLWDMVRGLRCAVWGNCVGVNMRTIKSLHVDGAGGVLTATAPAGTVKLDSAYGSTTKPMTAGSPGVITGDGAIFGFGSFTYGATYTVIGGYNIYDVTKISLGVIDVEFSSAPTNHLKCAATANTYNNAGVGLVMEVTDLGVTSGRLKMRYSIRNYSGLPEDAGFSTQIFCGAGA